MTRSSFNQTYAGITALVTGHTGFKGSWLSLWLRALGANVIGYSLPPATQPNNFSLTHLDSKITSVEGDIRDFAKLQETIDTHKPEIIFHLAAQPIVLTSFENPKETFDVNSGGTVNILEAAKNAPFVKAVVMITSDKCYDNQEWIWGYRETDKLGGHDPYSASKAMAELAINSYRHSFFKNGAAIASARAGNVIGGGDFSFFRLVPDSMKALMQNQPIVVRNPSSVRPWLHVLEPLSGYLWLGSKLLTEGHAFAEAWNFGPRESQGITVQSMVEKAIECWGQGDWIDASNPLAKGEMGLLRLNCDKSAHRLGWTAAYNWDEAVAETVYWFKAQQSQTKAMDQVCLEQIDRYTEHACKQQLSWAQQHTLQPTN
jgi:CDP-glucose 4,6-dehydratase